jgi:hypothetical protein
LRVYLAKYILHVLLFRLTWPIQIPSAIHNDIW